MSLPSLPSGTSHEKQLAIHDAQDNLTPVDALKNLKIDEQIYFIKSKLLADIGSAPDPHTIDCSLLNELINIQILNNPEHINAVKNITKVIWKSNDDTKTLALDILKRSQALLSQSAVFFKMKDIIDAISKPGRDRTMWIHSVIIHQYLFPLILIKPLKGSHSSKAATLPHRVKELMEGLNDIFSNSNLTSNPLSEEFQQEYRLFIDVLGPVTHEEFQILLNSKISFKEAVIDRRLFLDMKEKLSKKHQGELFIFVDKLKNTKTKAEFHELIAKSEINISDEDKVELQKAIEDNFQNQQTHQNPLIKAIINIISDRISTMWLGMMYDYLEMLAILQNV
jgi:hypothetical protein